MEKNFEITVYLLNQVKDYADFFHYTDKKMMNVLFVMGFNALNSVEDLDIQHTFVRKHQKMKLATMVDDTLDIEEEKTYQELIDFFGSDASISRAGEWEEKMKAMLKRRKLNITEEQSKRIEEIVKTERAKDIKICDSDVICHFISYGIKKLKYLRNQSEWGTDLCTDKTFNAPKEICTTIPNIFYMYIEILAQQLEISASDYIKIIIEEKFDDNKEMMKDILKKVK